LIEETFAKELPKIPGIGANFLYYTGKPQLSRRLKNNRYPEVKDPDNSSSFWKKL
jgi:hypothetical protein